MKIDEERDCLGSGFTHRGFILCTPLIPAQERWIGESKVEVFLRHIRSFFFFFFWEGHKLKAEPGGGGTRR